MKVKDLFPSKYMKASDLGKPWTFKITGVRLEEMHNKKTNSKEKKPVVYFSGPKKGLILNLTIAEQIAAATGQDDTDNWPGCAVTIYPTSVFAFGENHEVIRVRAAENGPAEAPPELVHDEEELTGESDADEEELF